MINCPEDPVAGLQNSFKKAKKTLSPCPICEHSQFDPIVRGERHGLETIIVLCKFCGLAMINPRPVENWFTEMYQKFYWAIYIGRRFKDLDDMYKADQCVERAHQIFDGIVPYLSSPPVRYLDIGCGLGGMMVECQNRFPNVKIVGIDPSENCKQFCNINHNLNILSGDWIEMENPTIPGPFDLISMIHVLEHIQNPVLFLKKAVKLMNKESKIYVEVPDLLSEIWGGINFFHIAHIYYMTEDTLALLFNRVGLNPISVHRGLAKIWPWGLGMVGVLSGHESMRAKNVSRISNAQFLKIKRHVLQRLPTENKEMKGKYKLSSLYFNLRDFFHFNSL